MSVLGMGYTRQVIDTAVVILMNGKLHCFISLL